jgi:colanic acid/amylovoran biosynthesis protein
MAEPMQEVHRPLRVGLFGAAPDTPNMGVSALFVSVVVSLAKYLEDVEFVVFDNGLGLRNRTVLAPDGRPIKLWLYGARGGRRYYRPENLHSMSVASSLGALGGFLNKGVELIDSCVALLDISGGDSFSDIYGIERFNNIYRPKVIAINRNKPLILLPQTYGPFSQEHVREKASRVARDASMAWARDRDSFEALKLLLGEDIDPAIHRSGVDVAFTLPVTSADDLLADPLRSWLAEPVRAQSIIGFNVSGLIYNDPAAAKARYGLKADYNELARQFLRHVLEKTRARIVLISHVMDKPGHFESDQAACLDLASKLGEGESRVVVAPATFNESQVKWLISRMDWFCGTRMHSTIAGLSSCVPTAAISYSYKTRGVFDTCGQGQQVFDPQSRSTDDMVAGLISALQSRQSTQESLRRNIPAVVEAAERQMQAIASEIRSNHRPR